MAEADEKNPFIGEAQQFDKWGDRIWVPNEHYRQHVHEVKPFRSRTPLDDNQGNFRQQLMNEMGAIGQQLLNGGRYSGAVPNPGLKPAIRLGP